MISNEICQNCEICQAKKEEAFCLIFIFWENWHTHIVLQKRHCLSFFREYFIKKRINSITYFEILLNAIKHIYRGVNTSDCCVTERKNYVLTLMFLNRLITINKSFNPTSLKTFFRCKKNKVFHYRFFQ